MIRRARRAGGVVPALGDLAPARVLSRGRIDFVWQILIIAGAYTVWRYGRGAVASGAAPAIDHARDLVAVESSLRSFVEADVQHWAIAAGWPIDVASWIYANAHFKGSILALAVIYLLHRNSFCFVRNMLIVAMALSLLCYALYPTAPPRLLNELEFLDLTAVTGQAEPPSAPDPLFNPYAAVPSMHVGFAIILGWSLALLLRSRALTLVLALYPLLITFVVVATGNHFWLDAVAGALVAAASAGVAVLLARLKPEWSFRRDSDADPAPVAAPEAAPA